MSEERYKKLFDEALDGFFIADADTGIIIDCNRAACELVEREKSELIGTHQKTLHPPEDTREFSNTFEQHLKEKEGKILEAKVITKNGAIKDVAIKANIFEFEGEKLIHGIFRDVTEQKKLERLITESEKKYRSIIENSSDGILMISDKGKLIDSNKSFAEMHGYTVEELRDMEIENLETPEATEFIQGIVGEMLEGKPLFFEVDHYHKDGHVFRLEVSTSLVDFEGEKIVIAFHRDISKRKKAEEELKKRTEQLEMFNRLAIGRELRMVELKKKIEELEEKIQMT